jgi:hypothetical protein
MTDERLFPNEDKFAKDLFPENKFAKDLFPNENKFAKDCEFEWCYDIESADMILHNCFYHSNLYELVSDEYFDFYDKESRKSTLSGTKYEKYDSLQLSNYSNEDWLNIYNVDDWEGQGYCDWEGYSKSTFRFYSDYTNKDTDLLSEDAFLILCPKIKHWTYPNIVCSAFFYKITNLVKKDKKISRIYWESWIPILVDPNLGQEFRALIERNKLFELYSKQFIQGFKSALYSHSGGPFSFREITKDELTRGLKVLKIPEIKIQELVDWSFENKNWSRLDSFLENYTF